MTPPAAGERTVVRAPNHLGDVVMALPALRAAAADVLIAAPLVPLLALPGGTGTRILPLERGMRGFADAARRLRAGGYRRGILLAPSLSSALLMRAGGVARVRGTATDRRSLLLDEPLPRDILPGTHRSAAYWRIVTGAMPGDPPVPVLRVPASAEAAFRRLLPDSGRPLAGLFPGSNASSRRWQPDRFGALAVALSREGWQVVVFGGPGETRLTAHVAGSHAIDLGGRTSLPELAAGLAACHVVISNDSGPLHLAAAVGTPVVGLFGAGDPVATRPLGEHSHILRHPELPCVPCVKNKCPRRGAGYILADAERECLRLIEVLDVLQAAQQAAMR